MSFTILSKSKRSVYVLGGFKLSAKKVDTDIFEVFFRRKPAMILVALRKNQKNRYGSVLAKEVDCTYSHAVKILQTLENLGLVTFEKKGRIKLIKLTKKGEDIADNIDNIKNLLK